MENKKKYVWFKGRCWRKSTLKNHKGGVLLVSLRDSSLGVVANPERLIECSKRQTESIEYFLS